MAPSVGIVGYTGRLGRRVLAHAEQSGIVVGLVADSTSWVLSGPRPSVVIDVSRDASVAKVTQYVRAEGVPLLSAVSGYGPDELAMLRAVAKKVPVMHVKNLSAGHRIHRKLARMLLAESPALAGVEHEMTIIDRHPAYKRDAPSATALALQEELRSPGKPVPEVFSVRNGMPVCEHEVALSTFDEEIIITHRVRDWSAYAATAMRAALWLASAGQPGWHELDDVFDAVIDSRQDHVVS